MWTDSNADLKREWHIDALSRYRKDYHRKKMWEKSMRLQKLTSKIKSQ